MNLIKEHLVFLIWILTAMTWLVLLVTGWPWSLNDWILQATLGFVTVMMLLIHGQEAFDKEQLL